VLVFKAFNYSFKSSRQTDKSDWSLARFTATFLNQASIIQAHEGSKVEENFFSAKMRRLKKKNSLLPGLALVLITIVLFLAVTEAGFRIHSQITSAGTMPKDLEHQLEGYRNHLQAFSLSNVSKEKEPGFFRIAVIGDSFAEGESREGNRSLKGLGFPKYLNTLLNEKFQDTPYEVINFGIGGTNTLDQYYILSHIASEYNPDLIILAISSNDLYFQDYNLNPYHDCRIKITTEENMLNWMSSNSATFKAIYTAWQRQYPVKAINKGDTIFERCLNSSLHMIKQYTEERNASIAVIYIHEIYRVEKPSPDTLFGGIEQTYDYEKKIGLFGGLLHECGWTYANSYPLFSNMTCGELLADDFYHFNSQGNNLLAKLAFNHLVENNLIPSCAKDGCRGKEISYSRTQ
jgi:lysophospholipase L1-like esterase